MPSTLLTAILLLTTLSCAFTIPRQDTESKLLKLPAVAVNKSQVQHESKRQEVSPLANTQTGTGYVINFSIGTPPQSVSVALDTGSSDTWVNPTCSTLGTQDDIVLCNSFPMYNPSTSTTSKDTGTSHSLLYGKGTADVEYFTDDFLIGGAKVVAQQFGVATSSSESPTGLMGVGPGIELIGYPTIIDQLAWQDITNSRAFSLDLRGVDSLNGAIIFGGIDTMKYIGPLEKCPIIPAASAPDKFDRYWINMKSVGITKPGDTPKVYPESLTPVFLDSGTTISRLPTSIFNAIVADFPGATPDTSGSGFYFIDCSVASQSGTVDFAFGHTVIHVPYHEFIWSPGSDLCYLGVAADDSAPVLGDSFLRAAFVVYDQDNQNLHLANAADCGTNLVAIGKGLDAVPSITGGCGAVSTSSSSTSSHTSLSSSSSTSSSLASITSPSPSSSSSSLTTSSSPAITSSYSSPIISSVSAYWNSTSARTPHPSSLTRYSKSISALSSASVVTPVSPSTAEYTISTIFTTRTYTISSCAPTITNCPYVSITTETISLYTTYCPVTPTASTLTSITPTVSKSAGTYEASISTVYVTTTYTVSSCAPAITNCPYGTVTTETYAAYTTLPAYEHTPVTIPGAYYTESLAAESSSYGYLVTSTTPAMVTPALYPTTVILSKLRYSNSTVATVSIPSGSYTSSSPAQFTGGAGIIAANIVAALGAVGAAVAMV